ncbi:MAG: HAD-IC family P-type ATPase [Atopobiaceae bacterium]|nr:HAD-IC family P-type ATPase [Atopobiaceae bacterium]
MESERGLSSQEVADRVRRQKTNRLPNKASGSVVSIVVSNVFTYFNAIFAFLAVLLIVAGSYKNLTFLPVVIANTIIGIVQQLRAKKVLDGLALLDVSSYVAVRDGVDVTVPSDELVQDDLIRLQSGQQIPADAIVVAGEAGVNEALLTGESDEVQKREGDELQSGSYVTTGALLARLTRVGPESYAAQLMAKAKAAKEQTSQMVRDIERIILVAGILILPVGSLMYWQSTTQNGATYSEAIVSMVSAVTGMIPEGLYLLVTIALALSAMRLAKKQVLFHDMHSMEALARVDVLCVDKTGTITSGRMKVEEVVPATGSEDSIAQSRDLLARYVHTIDDSNATAVALREYFPDAAPFVDAKTDSFSSQKKYSQVKVGDSTYRLGAPEFTLSDDSLDKNCQKIDAHMDGGMRVLAFSEVVDGNAHPLLLCAISDEIRLDAEATFAEFARQGVGVKVISGDSPKTVSKIAKEAGIEGHDRYVDASKLETREQIYSSVQEYTVFGRVKPDQKKELVEALQAQGLKVAMTGDGVNDILAMKQADCSIAMGSGSDAARQAAQVVLLDSDFSHMRQIVLEGRRNINNITRSATLFLYKNIFSLALALFSIFGAFTYPLAPNQVTLISMFNIGLPAFLLAFEPNEKKQEGRFIVEVLLKALPAAITSFVAIAYMMVFANLFGISQNEVGTASTYLLSVVGFLILIDIIRPPNSYRVLVLLLSIAGLVVGCGFFWRLFDIYTMSKQAWVLCIVFAFAEVGVMHMLNVLLQLIRERLRRGREAQ